MGFFTGSGAVRATRRGWIGGCHRRVPGRGRRSAPARARKSNIGEAMSRCPETKNNCYLCSLNGRPAAECCIEVQPGSKPVQYLNMHDRKGREVTCEWFDTKFPEGDPERKTKKAEAQRVRELALLKLRRRKKSKAKPSSRAAGETS